MVILWLTESILVEYLTFDVCWRRPTTVQMTIFRWVHWNVFESSSKMWTSFNWKSTNIFHLTSFLSNVDKLAALNYRHHSENHIIKVVCWRNCKKICKKTSWLLSIYASQLAMCLNKRINKTESLPLQLDNISRHFVQRYLPTRWLFDACNMKKANKQQQSTKFYTKLIASQQFFTHN